MKTTFAFFLFVLFCAFDAAAQETIVWSDIDCSQTHIVAPAGLRCRESNVVGTRGLATSTGGGQIKRWTSYGTVKQAKLYYYAQQVLSPRTYIQVGVMAEKIRGISPEAKNASSMSERTERSGVDFLTFVGAKGESCVGLRKIGPSTSAGAAWVLYATRCTPKRPTESDVDAFIAAADFRPE
jgi:hypothetical protein